LDIHAPGQIISFYDAVEESKSSDLVQRAIAGEVIVVVSDAGMPTVSDPGYRIVREAIQRGVRVSVIPGPSAVLAALAVSGLPVDRFTFEGFLPRKSGERTDVLENLRDELRTMVFFEAPHRLHETLADMKSVFGDERSAVVCRELTKTYEEVVRGNLTELVEWSSQEILGEITIVVSGASPVEHSDSGQWVELVATRVALGESQRDAIADVARELRVPKRDVYEAVLESRRS
jgi:16S rRNA (cytidine1402-2'-O)-methyltransferase